MWDHRHNAFLFGAIGGLALNVLQWRVIVHADVEERPLFDWLYWGQFCGIAVVGGFWALANDLSHEITPFIAFNLGVSVPAVLKATVPELNAAKRRSETE